MKNIMKCLYLALLVVVMAAIGVTAASASAEETSKVYTLEELRAMTGAELMALAIKDGSVQAKKAMEPGDAEIGVYTIPAGAKAPGNGRRLFVDLIDEEEALVAREGTASWCNTFDSEGYCTNWCSAKASGKAVASAKNAAIRFFREAETGRVYIVVRGNAVGDTTIAGGNKPAEQQQQPATHQHASFTATPAASASTQHASFTAGAAAQAQQQSQHAGFTAGSSSTVSVEEKYGF